MDFLALLPPLRPPSPGSPHEYVRPNITASGPLAITAGRHPLLEGLLHQRQGPASAAAAASDARGSAGVAGGAFGDFGPFGGELGSQAAVRGTRDVMGAGAGPQGYAANDTYVSEAATLHLITGPNMAGKSTYLKQASGIGCCCGSRFKHPHGLRADMAQPCLEFNLNLGALVKEVETTVLGLPTGFGFNVATVHFVALLQGQQSAQSRAGDCRKSVVTPAVSSSTGFFIPWLLCF